MASGFDLENPRAREDQGAGRQRTRLQAAVERRPVDHQDRLGVGRPRELRGGRSRAPQAGSGEASEDDVVGDLGQLRRLERDDARAVDGLTDPGVFFEDADVEAGLGQVCRREEAGGTTADDRDVQHDGQYKGRLVTAKLERTRIQSTSTALPRPGASSRMTVNPAALFPVTATRRAPVAG